MLSALNSLNASLYLCVWNRVDWWKWEWGDVGLKESWGERGATHTPSQGQGGATHPSAQRERGAADAPTQCERVLETGVDTYKIKKVTISKKNIFKKRLFVHIFFCLRSCKTPKENNTPAQVCCALESKSVSRAENLPLCNMCSAHKNHYRGQYLCLVQIE